MSSIFEKVFKFIFPDLKISLQTGAFFHSSVAKQNFLTVDKFNRSQNIQSQNVKFQNPPIYVSIGTVHYFTVPHGKSLVPVFVKVSMYMYCNFDNLEKMRELNVVLNHCGMRLGETQ